jgi:hypothetical protein
VGFLEDGQIELSNNRSERSIKPFVIGRKKFLFCNTPRGAKASAVIFQHRQICKRKRAESLRLPKLPLSEIANLESSDDETLGQLLPWNVKLPG